MCLLLLKFYPNTINFCNLIFANIRATRMMIEFKQGIDFIISDVGSIKDNS